MIRAPLGTRPLPSARRLTAWALGALALLTLVPAAGCPHQRRSDAERLRWLRARVADGAPGAPRALAAHLVTRGGGDAPLGEAARLLRDARDAPARALRARILQALGQTSAAVAAWLALTEDESAPAWARLWAARRVAALVDDAPLAPNALATLRRVARAEPPTRVALAAARALAAVSLRLNDRDTLTWARQRLGAVRAYRRTGRLSPLPALGLADLRGGPRELPAPELPAPGHLAPPHLAFGPAIETPDGTLSWSEDGPGTFAARLSLPARATPWELELYGEPSARVLTVTGDETREVASVDRLGDLRPARLRVPLAPGPAGALVIVVGSRRAAPQVQAFLRPSAGDEPTPPGLPSPQGQAMTPETRGDPITSLAAWAAAADAAWAAGDVELGWALLLGGDGEEPGVSPPGAARTGASEAARGGPPLPALLAVEAARLCEGDPTRPNAAARAQALALLRGALRRLPDDAEARARLATLLVDSDDVPGAREASTGPLGQGADWVALRLARGADAPGDAARAAARLARRLPRSCRAREAELDERWAEHKALGDLVGRELPGCTEVLLRAAALEEEAWRHGAARALLVRARREARPGGERARVALAAARLERRAGRLGRAVAAARAALSEGVGREESLRELLRATLLGGGAPESGAGPGGHGPGTAAARVRALLGETPGVSWTGRLRSLTGPDGALGAGALGPPLEPPERFLARAVEPGDVRNRGAEGASVRILLSDRVTRVFPDGAMIHRVHRAVELLDDGAVEELGELPVPDDAELLVARTWARDEAGTFRPFEPEDGGDKGAVSLPRLEPGAVAEVAYAWFQPAPGAGAWRAPPAALESARGHVALARYTLIAPTATAGGRAGEPGGSGAARAGAPVWRTWGRVGPPSSPRPGVWVWETRGRPRVLPEPLDPRPERRLATVLAAGGRARRGAAWLAATTADTLRTVLRATPSVRRMVGRARRGAAAGPGGASETERLRRLYGLVLDDVRDGGELGPLEQPASFTAAARAGERAALLTALCRAEGLACDLLLARPKTRGREAPEDAAVEAEDDYVYTVVRARVDGGEVWLDPAGRFSPFGYLPPLVQGVPALDPAGWAAGGPAVVRTPSFVGRDGVRRVDVEIAVERDGRWRATGREELTGLYAMGWRHVLAELTPRERARVLRRVVGNSFAGAEVGEVTLQGVERREAPLVVRWTATGALGPGRDAGSGRLLLGLSPERLGAQTVVLPARRTPLLQTRAADLVWRARVRFAPGLTVGPPPPRVRVVQRLVELDRTVRAAGSPAEGVEWTIDKRLSLRVGLVDPDRYDAWARAARAVDQADVVRTLVDGLRRAPEGPRSGRARGGRSERSERGQVRETGRAVR